MESFLPVLPREEPGSFVCHLCGKECSDKKGLSRHINNHDSKKCTICGKEFVTTPGTTAQVKLSKHLKKPVKIGSLQEGIFAGDAMKSFPTSKNVTGMKRKAVFRPNVKHVVKSSKIINQKESTSAPNFMKNGEM